MRKKRRKRRRKKSRLASPYLPAKDFRPAL
jgi:hypothetical protein